MCEQCIVKADSYLTPIPGWSLIRATVDGSLMKAGDWGLVQANDPTYVWGVAPWPEPPEDANQNILDQWFDDAENFGKCLVGEYPETGYRLIKACIEVGYDIDKQSVHFWLFDYLGKYISTRTPFSHDASGFFTEERLEDYGYLPKEDFLREVGKIYQLVNPHPAFGDQIVAFEDDDKTKWKMLEVGENVLLTEVDDKNERVKILTNNKIYVVHRVSLSKEPVKEPDFQDGINK